MKRCSKCRKVKPRSEFRWFPITSKAPNGRWSRMCDRCRSINTACYTRWKAKNPETARKRELESSTRWQQENPDLQVQLTTRWRNSLSAEERRRRARKNQRARIARLRADPEAWNAYVQRRRERQRKRRAETFAELRADPVRYAKYLRRHREYQRQYRARKRAASTIS
jgi:hypothetical protein